MEVKHSSVVLRIEAILNKLLNSFITVVFFIIVILTILLVILRYVFNTGLTGGNELMEYLFIYLTAMGSAIAIGKHEHIRIGYFIEKSGPRIQMIVDLFGIACIALINIIFIVLSYSWISKVGHSESPVMRIPMKMVQVSVPIGCILAVIYCVLNVYKIFKNYRKEN